MCGRYAFYNPGNFSDRFMVEEGILDYTANYNIAPGSLAPVVTRNSPNTVKLMKWGLIPGWSREFKMQFSTFNARQETLTTSRLFKPLLTKRRCLIPANGFYEWTNSKGKIPHFIQTADQPVFAFAGLYDIWTDAEGVEFPTFTIITTMANQFMSAIHHRMPVILSPESENHWLDHTLTDPKTILGLLIQSKSLRLTEHVVSPAVNKAVLNSPELIELV